MRVLSLLSAAAVATAWVVPDQAILESLAIQDQEIEQPAEHPFWDKVYQSENFWEDLEETFTQAAADCARHTFAEVADSVYASAVRYGEDFQDAFAGEDWLDTADHDIDLFEEPPHRGPPHHAPPPPGPPPRGFPPAGPPPPGPPPHGFPPAGPPPPGYPPEGSPPPGPPPHGFPPFGLPPPGPPPHGFPPAGPPPPGPPPDGFPPGPPPNGPPPNGPPHHGPPHHGPPHGPPHHGPPGKGPGKGPHHPHHPPNQTIWELISKSKYTTKLAAALGDFPDLIEKLNGTKANYTLFAPTDHAFEKIPKHVPKPPKEFLEKILTYHVSPEFYPAPRILLSRTIPTALEAKFIGKVPQRLSTQVGFRGLTVNFYSRIVAVDIFATNGVIHGIDSILLPPPKVVDIISALPGEFSTLDLALEKTGLYPAFNDTSSHKGGTLFAPSNFAFKRLGPRINAFLFSRFGLKYLKALILYHAGDNITLYSDAIYKIDSDAEEHPPHKVPKGFIHVDLPTGLEGKSLSIDIARYGRLITMKINGFTRVSVLDGIAADGVLHVIPNVLIPPKTPGAPSVSDDDLDLEEFKARFAPFVDADEDEWAEDKFEL